MTSSLDVGGNARSTKKDGEESQMFRSFSANGLRRGTYSICPVGLRDI